MINIRKIQKEVYNNKIKKRFNVADVNLEFNLIYEELAETFRAQAYRKKLPDLGEELADVVIYLLGLSQILDIDMEREILKKIRKNKKRQYIRKKGVLKRIKE